MSLWTNKNQVQAQPSKSRWVTPRSAGGSLLLLCAGAVSYFPKGAKGGSKSASWLHDPGPRPLPANAGGFLGTLSANETAD